MKQKYYSYLLVSLQYIIMVILLYINYTFLLQAVPLSIFFMGFIIGIYAIYCNKLHNFNIIPEIKDNANLVTHGIYKYVRHPMYLSVAVMMLGTIIFNLNFVNIFIYLILILALFLKARKEEKLWSKKIPQYSNYMKHSKMIIPCLL